MVAETGPAIRPLPSPSSRCLTSARRLPKIHGFVLAQITNGPPLPAHGEKVRELGRFLPATKMLTCSAVDRQVATLAFEGRAGVAISRSTTASALRPTRFGWEPASSGASNDRTDHTLACSGQIGAPAQDHGPNAKVSVRLRLQPPGEHAVHSQRGRLGRRTGWVQGSQSWFGSPEGCTRPPANRLPATSKKNPVRPQESGGSRGVKTDPSRLNWLGPHRIHTFFYNLRDLPAAVPNVAGNSCRLLTDARPSPVVK